MTAVEKICCGLSYLYVKLRQSLKQLGQSLSVQRLWVGAHNSAGIPRTLRTNGRTRNEKGMVGREAWRGNEEVHEAKANKKWRKEGMKNQKKNQSNVEKERTKERKKEREK
jgi:hypothetical protein